MPAYYEFEVSLIGAKPRLWRRFFIKKAASFQDLHVAIQDACGWENSHLFSFATPGRRSRDEIATGDPMGGAVDAEGPPAPRVKIANYFDEAKQCTYIYDFGDEWEHDVRLVGEVELKERFTRRLVAGKGAFPPEDCGGLHGFQRCLDVLAGKEKDEDDLKNWLGDWSPDRFEVTRAQAAFNS